MNFQKYAKGGEAFVSEIAFELGYPRDTQKAGRILRAVLHTLRYQSTPEECVQLIGQLPMLVKAIFVDGWKLSGTGGRTRKIEDFVAGVRAADGVSAREDFTSDAQSLAAIKAVLRVVRRHVSEGELEDFRRTLPEGLRPLLT